MCGYVCPACEGKGINEFGDPCDWCDGGDKQKWLDAVHNGPCCSDIEENNQEEQASTPKE